MMLFRSVVFLSLASVASASFAENTCSAKEWLPQDNSDSPTGKVRCCTGQFGSGGEDYARCDTSSCPNNFNAENRNCFNYGAPQNGKNAKANSGSEKCPFADSDHAICDTSDYDAANGVSCRKNPNGNNHQNHCLGKVKCNTLGVTVPSGKDGHSDGTAPYDGTGSEECKGAEAGFKAGDDCFYDGHSENWKVCKGPDDTTPEAPDKDEEKSKGKAYTKGDPHFKTFGGEKYDFHGECDLVMLHNPDFKGGMGMDIHIRTKIEEFWSSVVSSVIKIGEETMEIRADPTSTEWIWFNGEIPSDDDGVNDGKWHRTEMAGHLVRYRSTGPLMREANLYVTGHKEFIVMKAFKSFIRVDVPFEGSSNYDNSVGLLGYQAQNGKRLGRDGQTFIENVNEFGQEWQVIPEIDGKLFHSYEGAIVDKKCKMPPRYIKGEDGELINASTSLRGRRLGESSLDADLVEKACSHVVDPEEKKDCEFDVIATQDLEMASVW